MSHDKHCLLVEDAAGMIDPMTGMEQSHDHLNEKWINFASPMGPVKQCFEIKIRGSFFMFVESDCISTNIEFTVP